MKRILFSAAVAAALCLTQSCSKEPVAKIYDVPTTYNFTGADYSNTTTRLSMITELVDTMRLANTGGALNAQRLKNMFSNLGDPFSATLLNASSLQLKDQTNPDDQAGVDAALESAATTSTSGATAVNGTAGLLTSGTKKYLVDANGMEFKERIEKSMQGALIYYQMTAVLLSDAKVGASVALSERQKNWDAAFGYFGVPIDYPTNTTGIKLLGKYCNDRNALLHNGDATMAAFLKGRAAIDNEDNDTVKAQIAIIREHMEKGVAGTAVHYINQVLANIADNGIRTHNFSEGLFLVTALKHNPAKKITDAQLQTLLGYLGTNSWTVSSVNLQSAKDLLSTVYGFDAVKDQL